MFEERGREWAVRLSAPIVGGLALQSSERDKLAKRLPLRISAQEAARIAGCSSRKIQRAIEIGGQRVVTTAVNDHELQLRRAFEIEHDAEYAFQLLANV